MPSSGTRFRLVTLGRCAILPTQSAAAGVPVFGPGKPLALLAFLACAPRRSASREPLLDLLWSDSDPDRARNALRQMIWSVRHRLGEDVVVGDGDLLTLAPAIATDRDDLLAAIARGDCAGAVALYGGPFLPDLATPGGAEFEHWADVERQHLHAAYIRAAEIRVRELMDLGRTGDGVALARALRTRDSLREGSWRLLLEALLADRNLLGAAAEADALGRMLREERREPERSTQALLDRARASGDSGAPDIAADRLVADLVGREAEFGTAMRLWRTAQAGPLQHFHLTGEAGLGKSRLLDDIAARLRARGATVIAVRARVGEREVAGAALADIVRGLANAPGAAGISGATASILIGLEPGLAGRWPGAGSHRAGSAELWRLRSSALRDLIAAIGEEGPLALILDDLQWMDGESRSAVRGALERLQDRKILVATAARPGYDRTQLVPNGAVLALAPLDAAQVAELMTSIATLDDAALSAKLAEGICRAADGVPLLVLDTLRTLSDRGLLRIEGETWRLVDPPGTEQALAAPFAFAERINALPADMRCLMDTLALAPVPVPVASVPALLATSNAAAQAATEYLVHQGLAIERPDGLEPAHDRIRDRVNALMGVQIHQQREREVCERLASDSRLPLRYLPAVAAPIALGGGPGLERIYHRWLVEHRTSGDRRSDRTLARDLLGPRASDASIGALLRTRPLSRRLGGTPALTTGAVLALVLGGWAFAAFAGRPSQLVLTVQPLGLGGPGIGMVPPPIVEVADRFGRTVTSASGPVTMSTLAPYRLAGDTSVRLLSGRATFSNVTLEAPDTVDSATFRFSTAGLPPLRLTIGVSNADNVLSIVHGTLNGEPLDPADPVVRVRPDEPVAGAVEFDYTTRWAAAAVMLGAVATWRRGPSGGIAQLPLITPIEHGRSTLPIRFQAPHRPGTYHIVFAYGAEPDAKWVASGTNWSWGHPVWGDSSDISRWSDSKLREVRRSGRVQSTVRYPWGPSKQNVASRVVDVVVR